MPVEVSEHPSFERPDPDASLWRYIDLSKYLSMLSTRTMWFSRADLLGDRFEGSMTNLNVRLRPALYEGKIPDHVLRQMEEFRRHAVQHHFISCWHRSEYESAAMWRLYMRDNGIAMVSSYARMRDALGGEDHIFVGEVHYADYELDFIPEGDMFAPFMHKRQSYEHEREVRAVIGKFPMRPDSQAGAVLDYSLPSPTGLAISADVGVLIAKVHIAPDAPSWFAEVVLDATRRYGFEFPVLQSSLGGDPVY